MYRSPYILSLALLLSLSLLFFLTLRPPVPPSVPISPSDELDDLSLLRRASSPSASLSASRLSSPSRRPKIAFLFLTNTPLHFSPLWHRFFSASPRHARLFNIYVHADPFSNVSAPTDGVFAGRFIPAKRTARASPTLISATRRLLATAILDDPANTYFALLSQYCVPLHSFAYVYRSLFETPRFDLTDPDTSRSHGVRLRFRSYIEILSQSKNLWKRYTARGRYVMLPEVPFERFRVGSQFFVLTRRHARAVVRDRKLWKKFRLPCYREDACFPEEHYFPTLLSMEDPGGCTHYTLTRVNWTGTVNGHPYTYRPSEVSPDLIHQLRSSNYSDSYLFARKFSPDCLQPLMSIADKVIFRD